MKTTKLVIICLTAVILVVQFYFIQSMEQFSDQIIIKGSPNGKTSKQPKDQNEEISIGMYIYIKSGYGN